MGMRENHRWTEQKCSFLRIPSCPLCPLCLNSLFVIIVSKFFIGDDLFLALLAAGVFLHEEGLAGEGIEFGIVHEAGVGGRGGGEDLHLLGVDLQLLAGEVAHALHIGFAAAGMGGNQVIGEKLAFAGQPVKIVETGFELQQLSAAGFAH